MVCFWLHSCVFVRLCMFVCVCVCVCVSMCVLNLITARYCHGCVCDSLIPTLTIPPASLSLPFSPSGAPARSAALSMVSELLHRVTLLETKLSCRAGTAPLARGAQATPI
jgi:hypothetical protein